MIYQLQMVRQDVGSVLQLIGEPISDGAVISIMNESGLDGENDVRLVNGDGDYSFPVTYSWNGSDSVAKAGDLTNVNTYRASPRDPDWSVPLPESRP